MNFFMAVSRCGVAVVLVAAAYFLPVFAQDKADIESVRSDVARGDASAQTMLGYLYKMGEGVPKNLSEAAGWYRKAPDQGDAAAQDTLGDMYRKGEGVPQNPAEAARWYQKASDKGDVGAQVQLGLMYESGEGVRQNYVEAF